MIELLEDLYFEVKGAADGLVIFDETEEDIVCFVSERESGDLLVESKAGNPHIMSRGELESQLLDRRPTKAVASARRLGRVREKMAKQAPGAEKFAELDEERASLEADIQEAVHG